MKAFDKLAQISCLALSTLCAASAYALPTVTIDDTYQGSDDHGWGDRIGNHKTNNTTDDLLGGYTFEIHNMMVNLTGNILTVQVNTNYAGHAGLYGTGYGDLFLSTVWTPFGVAPYPNDDNSTGTKWTYGFSLDGDTYNSSNDIVKNSSDRFSNNTGGNGKLYRLSGSNDDNAILSDNITGGTFRNGQEVVIDRTSNTVQDTGTTGTWEISDDDANDYIKFTIDLTGTALIGSSEIALHWGMTCGNDTIEGAYAVPEPGILAILMSGLAGIAVVRRRESV